MKLIDIILSVSLVVGYCSLVSNELDKIFGKSSADANSSLYAKPTIEISTFPPSTLRRRCQGPLACEFHVPIVEIENAVIWNGVVYLNNPDRETMKAVNDMTKLYAGEANRLPSTLTALKGGQSDWLPGPRVATLDHKALKSCTSLDTSAFFLFPWEWSNTYHTGKEKHFLLEVNDNLLAVVASIVLQRITSSNQFWRVNSMTRTNAASHYRPHNLSIPNHYTLYMMKEQMGTSPNILFQLFDMMFEENVRPARHVLTGGPYCVRHLAWGTNMKPFYRDSLSDLRRTLFTFLQNVLRRSENFPSQPAPELSVGSYFPKVSNFFNNLVDPNKNSPAPQPIRVVIVTRNTTVPDNVPFRKLSRQSEEALRQAFLSRGIPAVICCNFKVINTASRVLQYFGYADICIGIHGAGLANCILMKPRSVIVELQTAHAFGFDSFMKIAHMGNGGYIFHDVRKNRKHTGSGAGAVLETNTVEDLTELALLMLAELRKGRPTRNWLSIIQREDLRERVAIGAEILPNVVPIGATDRPPEGNGNIHRFKGTTYISKPGVNAKQVYWLYPPYNSRVNMNSSDSSSCNDGASASDVDLDGRCWDINSVVTALGPTVAENFQHCQSLPYYNFRLNTMPVGDHRFECDKNFIQRFR